MVHLHAPCSEQINPPTCNVDLIAELSWLMTQQMVVNESISAVNNTYRNVSDAIQKLMGFLDWIEPQYPPISHSVLHWTSPHENQQEQS